MNIEQMRARLAEIVKNLDEYQAIENYTKEDVEKVETLNTEYKNLKANIETKEKIEAMKADSDKSERKVAPKATVKAEVSDTRQSKHMGFENQGDFLMAVKNAANGKIDRRFQNTAFEKTGEEGGFLIPEDFMSGIEKKVEGDDALLPKTRVMRVSGNTMSLNINEETPWGGTGVLSYWVAEGAAHTESNSKFKQVNWRLHKLGALVKATDELLEDAPALENFIKLEAPEAINQKINEAILTGDGMGKPSGILDAGFTVSVAKESGQAADTVVAANIVNMYSRMLPKSRANAAWYINAAVEPQLRLMKDAANNYIYLAPGSQMNQSPYGLLLGRPVIPMMGGMKALGDKGDIFFADLSYYYSIVKTAGLKQAMSTHVYFLNDISAFKFTFRVDGSCPFSAPVTTQYGSYDMSGIVTLAERA